MPMKFSRQEIERVHGKTVVMTGATGGLGEAMCRYLLAFGADLIMVTRNKEKSKRLCDTLLREYPGAKVRYLLCDLSSMDQVKAVSQQLQQLPVDILMLNAGAYDLPRVLTTEGYDNVFAINFLSHYYLTKTLLPLLKARKGKVTVTGSIAHRFQELDPQNPDFSRHQGANNIYGNSKRFLMFALMELLKDSGVEYSIGHPGISYTGITANYPPEVLKIVKPSMLFLFMHKEEACLSILRAVLTDVPYCHWIGPGYFDIWGNPVITPLHSCSLRERRQIFTIAEKMFRTL